MVRTDTLRRSLLALVPATALLAACSGGAPDAPAAADPGAPTTSETATQPAAEDPANGVATGTEGEDQGYAAALGQDGTTPPATDTTPDDPNADGVASKGDALLSTRGTTLLNEIKREYDFLNKPASYYSHTTYMNESTGTRRTDCSGYLGYALNRVMPDAYAKVPHPNTYKPLADDWYNYLSTRYTTASTQSTPRWRRITQVTSLKPGDVIAWLKPASVSSNNTGHVLIVTGYPRAGRSDKNEVLVPISDATESPHANDSRGTQYTGVGTGTLGLKVDSNGAPIAYYWRGGESYTAYSTKIALGRVE